MHALVLAAGIGKRLRPITDTVPKCLVEVNGKPILVNTLEVLESRGIEEVVLVVGYLRDKVYERIGHRFGKVRITYVENPKYDTTNNIYSLWLARDYLNCDTVLLECDVFFEGALIDTLLEGRQQCKILLDRFQSHMDGTVVEMNSDGIIQRLMPSRNQHPGFDFSDKYKTVNVYFFSKKFLQNYFMPHLDLYVKTQSITAYYEVILGALIYYGKPKIHGTVIDGIKWFEIDDEADLAQASYYFSSKERKLQHINKLHGGYWRYDLLDFSYLYNPYYPPTPLVNKLKTALPHLIRNYPSGMREITHLLGRALNLRAHQIIVGNGASEIIRALNHHFVTKMTIPIPTFNEYENTLKPEQINYFDTKPNNFILDPEKYADAVLGSSSNAALLINPNNPTSLLVHKEEMKFLLEKLRDIEFFIIDESFMDFVPLNEKFSVYRWIDTYPNVILVRSMSKEFGVPGLRLGYAACSNIELVRQLENAVPIWNISSLAEQFLEDMPQFENDYKIACDLARRDTDELYEKLTKVSYLKPYRPTANYIFAKVLEPFTSRSLRDRLFSDYSILIKDCSDKTGLSHEKYVRIASRKPEDNEKLLKALHDLS